MGAFLSVSRGSEEPLKFVEVEYRGGEPNSPPIAMVGKGVTFDRYESIKFINLEQLDTRNLDTR